MDDLDVNEFRRWLAQAESALASAQMLAVAQSAWSCFCCEQAAQLAVKGLLHAAGLEAWGHDLVELESRFREPLGAAWPDSTEQARRLARHYIPTRYPTRIQGAHPRIVTFTQTPLRRSPTPSQYSDPSRPPGRG